MDLLLPGACAGCGRYGELLCSTCVSGLRPAGAERDRFAAADPGIIVGDTMEMAVAAFIHEGTTRRVLQRLKYGGAGRLAAPLARAAAPALRSLLARSGPAPLVPVPVHPARRRQRGYNQAELLASELGRLTGLPILDLLLRNRPTTRQHGLGRAARLHNLRGALAVRGSAQPTDVAIVVDDILTTSATLEACAETLRRHGASRVYGFAVAREV
ncbi:MAG: ComF family protein [Chloroflexota bacterium]|nr:ComF family protein [Chloroflexota bacterium]